MTQTKAIALMSSNIPAIPDAKTLASVRMDKSIPHYKDLAQAQRVKWLKGEIMSLNMIRHQMAEDWQVEFDAQALDEFIMDDHFAADYTFSEIKDAFKRGLMGDYGDYYGLTAESLYGFIRGYFMSEKKRTATRLVREALEGRKEPVGEYFLEKVRYHAEQMARNNKV